MGIMDAFAAEDRVQVTASTYYKLMREVATSELLQNAVKCDVPHCYIREMITGEKEGAILPEIAEIAEVPEKAPETAEETAKPKATIKRVPVEGRTISKTDWIKRLAGEGKTIKEICEITGCSEPTARKYKAEVMPNEDTDSNV